jgi:polysaccharide lyase-like protein
VRVALRLPRLAPALAVLALATTARATVLFESRGVKKDWDSFTSPDQVSEVTSPIYGSGPTGLRMLQKFTNFGSYHCEVRKHDGMRVGQDVYFGEAMQLPSNWIFHDQNVTFQQFARSDVFASPWALVFDGSGTGQNDLGSVANLQGTWIRLVIRLKLLANGGLFETWINGTKTASVNVSYDKGGPGVRWSVGMYCTYWRRAKPAGLDPMILFHDQMRIATTLEEADPASWSGAVPPPPSADAGSATDAASPVAVDAAPAVVPDAGGGRDAQLPLGDAASHAPSTHPDGASGGASGREDPDPAEPRPSERKSAGGCSLSGAPPPGLALILTALALLGVAAARPREWRQLSGRG